MNFGAPPLDPQELASAIASQIGRDGCPARLSEFDNTRTKWTAALHLILRSLGEERGMRVSHQGKKTSKLVPDVETRPQMKAHDKSEFLVDHAWFDKSESMTFAAELEFSRYDYHVLDDFRKLLYVKASLKLCIFSDHAHTKRMIKIIEDELGRNHAHICGEHYVMIRLCNWTSQHLEAFHVCAVAHRQIELRQILSAPWKRWGVT